MSSFAILVDSGTDVPVFYQKRYPIYTIPLSIIYPEKVYADRVDIQPEDIYARFPTEIPKTSLPSGEAIEQILYRIRQDGYREVLVVTISSGLSGTLQSIRLMADEHPEFTFDWVDSKSIGVGAGMQAMLAARCGAEGMEMKQAAELARRAAERTRVLFCIPTLEYLRKGGRIGLVSSFLGTKLGLKPVITCNQDGIYETLTKARGWERAIHAAVQHATESAKGCSRYCLAVAHGNSEEEGLRLLERMKQALPHAQEVFFGQISPALVVHTGPGLLGIGVQRLD